MPEIDNQLKSEGPADPVRTRGHRGFTDSLNEATVKALPLPDRGNRVHYFAGATLQGVTAPKGFGVRVTAGGSRAFILNYRLRGREHRYTIGEFPTWSALRAVREARELRQRVDKGENPLEDRAPPPAPEATKTVADVLDQFMRRRGPSLGIRTRDEYRRAFDKHLKPLIGDMGIYDLRRSQVADALDKIADKHGEGAADHTLAYLSSAFNWLASRDDDFTPPIRRGMKRTRPKERARDRTLSDDEIRAIWPHLSGQFGDFCKMLLFTGQRRGEVAGMRRSAIDKAGVWSIAAAEYKSRRPHVVPLSQAALAIVVAQPKQSDLVFPSRANTPLTGFGKPFLRLVAASGVTGWTFHDLRRTARTLMARAGVRPDISERVLGHALQGVEATYDRHSYLDEKRDALERLAAEIECILNPPDANVVTLRGSRA